MPANISDPLVQDVAIQHMLALRYDGWISTQDIGDDRLEVCIFRPDTALEVVDVAFCGP